MNQEGVKQWYMHLCQTSKSFNQLELWECQTWDDLYYYIGLYESKWTISVLVINGYIIFEYIKEQTFTFA